MLVLLLSIFFSGFFLPLENFRVPIHSLGYALPLTHGIAGFQAIMLRGIGAELPDLAHVGHRGGHVRSGDVISAAAVPRHLISIRLDTVCAFV